MVAGGGANFCGGCIGPGRSRPGRTGENQRLDRVHGLDLGGVESKTLDRIGGGAWGHGLELEHSTDGQMRSWHNDEVP